MGILLGKINHTIGEIIGYLLFPNAQFLSIPWQMEDVFTSIATRGKPPGTWMRSGTPTGNCDSYRERERDVYIHEWFVSSKWGVYIYIHICLYVYTYIYIHIHIHIHIHTYIKLSNLCIYMYMAVISSNHRPHRTYGRWLRSTQCHMAAVRQWFLEGFNGWKARVFAFGASINHQLIITLWWTNIAMENHLFLWENPLFRLGHFQ